MICDELAKILLVVKESEIYKGWRMRQLCLIPAPSFPFVNISAKILNTAKDNGADASKLTQKNVHLNSKSKDSDARYTSRKV